MINVFETGGCLMAAPFLMHDLPAICFITDMFFPDKNLSIQLSTPEEGRTGNGNGNRHFRLLASASLK